MVYPNCCEVCSAPLVEGERVMCLQCNYEMPRCNIHTDDFNTLHKRLAGHAPIERAAGFFFYYRGSPYTAMIHAAKYNGRPRLGRELAEMFAREIEADGFFNGIDLILPVPLHRVKLIKRGYNQSAHIAAGISNATGIRTANNLIAKHAHATQTRRNAFQRWKNAKGIYDVENSGELAGKHVLVVDDVITTGATMLACCEAIHRASPSTTISVLSLGVTELQ
ncbi:MAG: ComF family protein [Bacteroides sp.]|nr:ComF family protein [Bacteroides sp.]